MSEESPPTLDEQRRLVQRVLDGRIPAGRDFDACRGLLRGPCEPQAALDALATVLHGFVADPFVGIEDSARAVAILKAMARGELEAGELL